jgi:hypothetical protein
VSGCSPAWRRASARVRAVPSWRAFFSRPAALKTRTQPKRCRWTRHVPSLAQIRRARAGFDERGVKEGGGGRREGGSLSSLSLLVLLSAPSPQLAAARRITYRNRGSPSACGSRPRPRALEGRALLLFLRWHREALFCALFPLWRFSGLCLGLGRCVTTGLARRSRRGLALCGVPADRARARKKRARRGRGPRAPPGGTKSPRSTPTLRAWWLKSST